MCSLNSSFFDKLHSLNGNCTGNSSRNFTVGELNHPVTSFIYITIATLCIVFSLLTHFRYNSVTVLNLTARNHVISNYPWIAYFTVLSMRSVLGSCIYGYTSANYPDDPTRLTVYFIADGALKSLEVLCLSWALYHQRIYRSAGFLQQEINSLNAEEFSSSGSEHTSVTSAATERIKKSRAGALFVGQFILAMLFMILLEELYETGHFTGKSQGKRSEVNKDEPQIFYWIYMGFFWTQCITTVVLAVFIAANKNEDGPTFMVKLLVVVGVILTLPGDIPSNIWSDCMHCKCFPRQKSYSLTAYDFALFFSIPSVIIFFIVLRTEFLRLDQEVQYSVIEGEVDSLFSVHSQTIAES